MRLGLIAAALTVLVGCSSASAPQAGSHEPAALSSVEGSGPLTQLHMLDELHGWAYGLRVLARTSDGAATFVDATPPGVGDGYALAQPTFLDAYHAIAEVVGPTPNQSFLERTTDGGQTWVKIGAIRFAAGTSITFVDLSHGWAVEQRGSSVELEKVLFRTTDGGATWSRVYTSTQHLTAGPAVTIAACGWMGPPVFSTPTLGAVGLNCPGAVRPKLALTGDGGSTWRDATLPELRAPAGITMQTGVDRIEFFGARDVMAFASQCTGDANSCSSYGALYASADGGKTWSVGSLIHGGGWGLHAVNASDAFLTGGWLIDSYSPWLLVTTDAGATWASLKLPLGLGPSMHGGREYEFVDPQVGFVAAWDEFAPATRFYRTGDGGRSFTQFTPKLT